MVHVAFNVAGVLLWLFFIPVLAEIAVAISPAAADLEGSAHAAVECRARLPMPIPSSTLSIRWCLGFTTLFARLAKYLVPDRETARGPTIEPEFLNNSALKVPSVALQQIRLELGRVGVTIRIWDLSCCHATASA